MAEGQVTHCANASSAHKIGKPSSHHRRALSGEHAIRILITTDCLREPVRGIGRVCEILLRELVAAGHEVVPIDSDPNPRAEAIAGRCEVLPVWNGPAKTGRWHFGLLRKLERRGIRGDAVISLSSYPQVLGRHPRLVFFVHDLHMLLPGGSYQRGKRSWFRAFLGRALMKAAQIVCVSDCTRQDLLERYPGVDPERVSVVYNAFEPKLAPAAGDPKLSDKPYLLCVGQLEHRKNQRRLLDAFAAARQQGLTSELRLAGQRGPGAEAIVDRLRAEDLAKCVHWHEGPDDEELRQLYSQARGLVFPSLYEGFGIPLLEAMQAGIPILCSDRSCMPEITGEEAALQVDPYDQAAIAAGMIQLDSDEELRTKLVAAGTRRLAKFTPARQRESIEAVLEKLHAPRP